MGEDLKSIDHNLPEFKQHELGYWHTKALCAEIEIDKYNDCFSGENEWFGAFLWYAVEREAKILKRAKAKISFLTGKVKVKKGGITREMIENARNYPISSLCELDRYGKALCPAHDDTRPSLSVRDNRCYCFVCGFRGNSVDYIMKSRGLSFKDSILYLNHA